MDHVPTFINKPTSAVHIQNGYTATERKLVNICLVEGLKDNFASEYYTVNVWEALSLLGCDKSKNSTWLKEELFEALRSKPIRWNVLKKDNSLQEWTCSFLAGYYAERVEGKITFQINPMAAKQFNNRGIYSRLMLQIQAPIKNGHALTLYEFLNDELHRKKTHKQDISITLKDLRMLMDIRDNQYQQFKHFNSQAIKPAFEEVNKHTDIQASYRQVREGRRVVSLIISAIRTKNFQLSLGLPPITEGDDVALDENTRDQDNEPDSLVAQLLVSHGVSRNKARSLAKKFPVARIVENLRYGLEQAAKSKVKQLAPFVVKAIEEAYVTLPSPDVLENRHKAAWQEYRTQQITSKFKALTPDEQRNLRSEFAKKIETGKVSSLVQQRFKNYGGWDDQMVAREFNDNFLECLLSSPEEKDFAVFSVWWEKQELKELMK